MGSIPACAGEPPTRRLTEDLVEVYPRVCGGTTYRPPMTKSGQGLSPRVRGNPRRGDARMMTPRSIPACAGEPSCDYPVLTQAQVYPRVCGGTGPRLRWPSPRGGLSPRVRGNLISGRSTISPTRSIPACAGEPPRIGDGAFSVQVYPRVCGGTTFSIEREGFAEGLSPRVRGNPSA